jgi:TonB family protein
VQGRSALRVVLACSIGLLLVGSAEPAAAQVEAPTAPSEPPLEPPRLHPHREPTYPAGETTSETIVVELVVESNGTVSGARVAGDGAREPFASAAIDAVQSYRFTPARRAGQPIRARIRVAVVFTAPAAPSNVAVPATTGVPAAPAPTGVDEVDVYGSRNPVSSPTEQKLGRAEIRMVPGAFGDPYRAIDILPGVVPIVSGLPYYFVRGAPPSAVGYFVDEVRVPYLFHFGLGPGVIQPALIEQVSLHPAAYPARYGRYAGGIIAGQLREPATELRGEAQIRLYDAGAYVESPLGSTGRWVAGVGGRYSYTAALISLVAPGATIDYRDYNARVSYAVNDEVRVSALTFGAYDYASSTSGGVEKVLFASEFHRLDLRVDRDTATASSRVALMLGIDRTRLEFARFAQNRLLGLRGRHRVHVTKEVDVEIGADALGEFYAGDLPSPYAVGKKTYDEANAFFAPRTDTAVGGWVAATYYPAKGFELDGTLRGDVFTSDGKILLGPSPRASMRVPLSRRIAFLGALGVAPQPPAFAIPVPAVGYRGLPGGLAYAYQKSAGVELQLPAKFSLRTVGFHHSYFNLRDFTRDRSKIDITDTTPPNGSPAQSYGLEVFLTRKLSERYGAFLSYTLSRSVLGSTQYESGGVTPFDRTHVLQLGGAAALGSGWHSSARMLLYTGWPAQAEGTSSRLPLFTRFDLRIEKRWAFRKAGYISLVFEGLNVTGSRDVVGRNCSPAGGCRDEYFGPLIVPSIGVEGAL